MKKMFAIVSIASMTFATIPAQAGMVGKQYRITDATTGITYVAGTFSDSLICGDTTLYPHGGTDAYMYALKNDGSIPWAFAIGTDKNDTVRCLGLTAAPFYYPMIGIISNASMSDIFYCDDDLGGQGLEPIGTTNTVGLLLHYIAYQPWKDDQKGQFAIMQRLNAITERGKLVE